MNNETTQMIIQQIQISFCMFVCAVFGFFSAWMLFLLQTRTRRPGINIKEL